MELKSSINKRNNNDNNNDNNSYNYSQQNTQDYYRYKKKNSIENDLNYDKYNNSNNSNLNYNNNNYKRYDNEGQIYNNSNFSSVRSSYERKSEKFKNPNSNYSHEGVNLFPSEVKYKENKIETDNLENRLSILLNEKKNLENSLLKLPDRPRSLNDMKIKKETNEKITKIEEQINQIRTRMRQLNY